MAGYFLFQARVFSTPLIVYMRTKRKQSGRGGTEDRGDHSSTDSASPNKTASSTPSPDSRSTSTGSSDGKEDSSDAREKEQKRKIDRLLCWIGMSASMMVLNSLVWFVLALMLTLQYVTETYFFLVILVMIGSRMGVSYAQVTH